METSLLGLFCIHRCLFGAMVQSCQNLPFWFARVDMLGFWAWSDDLQVIFEFLDDDTKLAQSCRNWLHVQHWYVVALDPAMRVTLAALMDIGKDCDKHTQDTPPLYLSVCLSCCLNELGRDQRKSSGFSFEWVPHGFALVCAVKQDLSFLLHPVTRPAATVVMVLVSFAGARRRAM